MGTTFAYFHWLGNVCWWRDKLKSSVTEGVMVLAVSFSIRADIPSGPVAFALSSCLSIWHTSSSVQRISVDEMLMF